MGNKRKIFNDPVYGLISFKHEILYDLINHEFFQRLRRISQMGLASIVYPGAVHTRFQHALGATHLMSRAITLLKNKGVEITNEEDEAVSIAILLHDIGHGPFSHALEYKLINISHEKISLGFMDLLNREFDGKLSLAIKIYKNQHQKKFLHELVSSQLDMDRMDYLNRDSFYSGVAEGVIGYDRIIQMLNVHEDNLVIEEKGIYSIEKFLMARRIMYWQVYLHKTGIAAEQMLIAFIDRLKLVNEEKVATTSKLLELVHLSRLNDHKLNDQMLRLYSQLDDHDVYHLLKSTQSEQDYLLHFWSDSLLKRKLLKIKLSDTPFERDQIVKIRQKTALGLNISEGLASQLIIAGKEINTEYDSRKDEILILMQDSKVISYSQTSPNPIITSVITKYFLCNPEIKN